MRVLVVDDHSIIRMALKHILVDLAPDVELIQAATGPQGLACLDDSVVPFDLVITDLYMPGGGFDLVAAMAEMAAPAPVVVFTVSERAADVREALARGARAFIPKTTDDLLIISILRLVIAGGTYVPPGLSGLASSADADTAPRNVPPMVPGFDGGVALAERPSTLAPATTTTLPPLTRRQFQVLELLAEGMSNADIGQRMGLNLSTVKSHVTGVLRALNVSSRTQAVLAFKQSDWSRR